MDVRELALHAARLLRVPQAQNPRPQVAELVHAAARLLGAAPSRSASPPLSAFARQRSAAAVAEPEGVMARLRKLFGKS